MVVPAFWDWNQPFLQGVNLCCQFQDVTLAQIRHAAMPGFNDCGQTARPSDPQMWAMLCNKRWGLPLVHIEEPHPHVGSMVHHQCPSESCHVEVSPVSPVTSDSRAHPAPQSSTDLSSCRSSPRPRRSGQPATRWRSEWETDAMTLTE